MMFSLRVMILTLSCLTMEVNGVDVSETHLAKLVKRLEILDRKIDDKLAKFDERLAEFEKKMLETNSMNSVTDKRIHEISDVIDLMKDNIKHLKQPKEMKPNHIAKNNTDLEERVSDLEVQMVVVEAEISGIKLGLAAIADRVDELQEAENVQNQNILFLEQEVSVIHPFTD